MSAVWSLGLALLVFAQSAVAAPPPVAFTSESFRAHVNFLADDLLEGRGTGTRGHEIAARYVATQFEGLGLKPGGENGTWYQRATFRKISRGADRASITVSGAVGEQRFIHAEDVVISPSPREQSVELSAPLVFVGYGIEDERFGLNDYRGLDVKGCIVVALRGFPKGMPSEEGAHLGATKGEIAEKHGAIGLLLVDTLESEKVVPWSRRLKRADESRYAWIQPNGQVFEDSPGIRAMGALSGPAAEAVFAGAPRTLQSVREEADRTGAAPGGFKLKTRVTVRSTASWENVYSPNVIGILPGSDADLAKQYIVLSAHLDHFGIKVPANGGKDPDPIFNGALDNAAGIATMLEVARAAASDPDKPRRSMMFIATTAEEMGGLGAEYFARIPTVPIEHIVGNVNLDSPLLLYPFTDVIAFGANHSTIGPMVDAAVTPMNIKLSPDPMPEQGLFTRADHYMLVRQGVPAVVLATGFANGGEKFWGDFWDDVYHSPKDDLTQKIDWDSGARFAEVNYRIARAMTDSDQHPLWFVGDYFGDTFAPDSQRAPR
jgi:hypothetical protein